MTNQDKQPPNDARLLRKSEAAAALGLSISSVNRLLASGALQAVRLGSRCVRIPSGELTKFRAGLPIAAYRGACQ